MRPASRAVASLRTFHQKAAVVSASQALVACRRVSRTQVEVDEELPGAPPGPGVASRSVVNAMTQNPSRSVAIGCDYVVQDVPDSMRVEVGL